MAKRYNRQPSRRHDGRQTPARLGTAPASRRPRHVSRPYPQQRRYEVPGERKHGVARPRIPLSALLLGLLSITLLVVAIALLVRGCASRGVVVPSSPSESDEAPVIEAGGEAEAAPPEPVEVRLAMIGDILQHMGVYGSGLMADGSYNFDHVFTHIATYLVDQDIKVVNQETPLGGADLGFSGYPTFNGPQEMGDAEVAAGFNVVLRASNHTMDRGYDGLRNELAFWEARHPEVRVLGAVNPDDAAVGIADPYTPTLWEKDGFTIALLNFTYDLNGFEDPNGAVAMLYDAQATAAVELAESEADLTVVFPHWGTEYQLYADDDQRACAQRFIDAGADVIVGGHPHVIEPFEVLTASDGRQVPCFWSVGNFISTQIDNENLVGGLAKVVMRKEADGTARATLAEFWPTVTHKGVGADMTTYLLADYTDDLAVSNGIDGHSYNPSLTPAWADAFCVQVLGERYDTNEHVLRVDLAA